MLFIVSQVALQFQLLVILCLPNIPFLLRPLKLRSTAGRLLSDDVALHLEVLALRHQLAVLQRTRPRRIRLAKTDRWLRVGLSRLVIAWHRRGFRLWWTWKRRHRPGRPTVPAAEHARTHLALDKGASIPRPVMPPGMATSWRSLRSVACTIETNAARPERATPAPGRAAHADRRPDRYSGLHNLEKDGQSSERGATRDARSASLSAVCQLRPSAGSE